MDYQSGHAMRTLSASLLLGGLMVVVAQSVMKTGSALEIGITPQASSASAGPLALAGAGMATTRAPLMVGDKLKIEVFQKNAAADGQREAGSAARGAALWGLRQEVSGLFSVQEDGRITVPILGVFSAVNRTVGELGADIVAGFRATYSGEARVAVSISERPPIYVVGAVKSPGSFRYEAGLTALHAIALSGGMERGASDQWSRLELARESAKAVSATQTLKTTLAELAVLRAERDGAAVKIPEELSALIGQDAATLVVDQAHERRKVRLDAFTRQRNALKLGIDVAMKNLALGAERLTVLTKGASARTERVDIMQGFVAKGMSSQALLNQAQAELSDSSERALNAKSMIGDAEYKVSLANQELTKFDLDRLIDREAAIETLEKAIVEARANLQVFESIKGSFPFQPGQRSGASAQAVEIVRKYPTAVVLSPADPTTPLTPGDLVRVLEPQMGRAD